MAPGQLPLSGPPGMLPPSPALMAMQAQQSAGPSPLQLFMAMSDAAGRPTLCHTVSRMRLGYAPGALHMVCVLSMLDKKWHVE